MLIKKYIKNPIEIEAVQFTDGNKDQVRVWARDIQNNVYHSFENSKPCLVIPTLQGEMICSLGDYIIKESFPTDCRKLYPCKKEIFEKTYNEV